jgi:hypothetical protein
VLIPVEHGAIVNSIDQHEASIITSLHFAMLLHIVKVSEDTAANFQKLGLCDNEGSFTLLFNQVFPGLNLSSKDYHICLDRWHLHVAYFPFWFERLNLFYTSKGDIGTTTSLPEVNDEVCVIKGYPTPFIIRNNGNSQHLFVRHCCIPSLSSGIAVDLVRTGELCVEILTII